MLELTTLRLYLKCDFKRYLDPLCQLRWAEHYLNGPNRPWSIISTYIHITRQKKAAQEQPYAFCIYVPVQSIEGPVPETIMYVLVCLLQYRRVCRQPLAGSLYGGNRSNRDTIHSSCYHGPDSTLALMRKHPLSMYIFYRLLFTMYWNNFYRRILKFLIWIFHSNLDIFSKPV